MGIRTTVLTLVLAVALLATAPQAVLAQSDAAPTIPAAVFTTYVESFDPRTGMVTVTITGPAGSYRVEVVSAGKVVFSRTVFIPGAITVALEKQEVGGMIQMSGVIRILDPQTSRVLHTSSVFISFYAPKPELTIERAVMKGGSVVLTLDVVTSIRTDVAVYVDGKLAVSRTVSRPTKMNVTVSGGGLHTIDITMTTDFGSYSKSLALLIPTVGGSSGGSAASGAPRILGVATTRNSVVVNYETPTGGVVELYIDGQLAATRDVAAGRGSVTFMIGELEGRHTIVVKLRAGGQEVSMSRVVGSEQRAPQIPPEALGAAAALAAIVAAALLSRRGGIGVARP